MTDRPTPEEAARALDDVRRRKDQTWDSVRQSRWVGALMGAAIFVLLAAPDFFGTGVTTWTSLGFTALVAVYWIMLSTRGGSSALGRTTRLRRQEVSPRFARVARAVILAVLVAGLAVVFVPHPHLHLPYAGTVAGAVLGLAVAVFGGRLQTGLNALARPRDGDRGGAVRVSR